LLRRVGPFPAQKEAVTASASIMPRGGFYPVCWHKKPKNLFIARLFEDTVRFGEYWLNRLITGWLWRIESGTVRGRKRPAIILYRCLTPKIHDLRLHKRRHWLMLVEIEDFECFWCAVVQLNPCANGRLLQGCFPTRDGFAADFHCSFIVLVGSVCSMMMIRSRA
jgi:hypothetical protein